MTHQPQPSGPDMLDLIFANRNKIYGAYQLRREYPGYLARALAAGILLVVFFLALMHLIAAAGKTAAEQPTAGAVILGPARQLALKQAPPPVKPAATSTAARPAHKFAPPVIVQNNEVAEEAPPHTVEELLVASGEISSGGRDGNPDAPPRLDEVEFPTSGTALQSRAAEDGRVYEMPDVQKNASFPGGEREMLAYLYRTIRYPELARQTGVQGPVVLSFVVNTDGSISDIVVLKDPGGGCASETVRVVRSMPHWIPAEANGHPVKLRFILPVRFELR